LPVLGIILIPLGLSPHKYNSSRQTILVKTWIETPKLLFNFILGETSFKFQLNLIPQISRQHQTKMSLGVNSERTYPIFITITWYFETSFMKAWTRTNVVYYKIIFIIIFML